MNKIILHVDMDAFFASVEQRDNPELRGKPIVVGSPASRRGVVAAASYEARRYGIHSAMPSGEAVRRCPQLIIVRPDMSRYQAVSARVFEIFERFTPLVEKLSVDEAFLDVTGSQSLFGSGVDIARKIRQAIKDELQLTASVGVAPNKFLAKLASDMDKPDGLTVVPFDEGEIIKFLAPLPVGCIWGVGAVTGENLKRAGIVTVADLQQADIHSLERIVGAHSANHLKRLALGMDLREIQAGEREKSISKETTFARDVTDRRRLEEVLISLVDEVSSSLRAKGYYAQVARLKLRWQGFKTITRQRQLNPPCCDTFTLQESALFLLRRESLERPVRLIGFGVAGLTEQKAEQLSLFSEARQNGDKLENLSRSVDSLRRKFGDGAVHSAAIGSHGQAG